LTPPPDTLLQLTVEDCDDNQGEGGDETVSDDDLEIVEQSALDRFSAILQKAQKTAAEAERQKKSKKRPKTYDGNSDRTKRRNTKKGKDHEKNGYLSVFGYMAYIKAKNGASRESTSAPLEMEESTVGEKTALSVSEMSQVRHRCAVINC
jgi:hypothetical protein